MVTGCENYLPSLSLGTLHQALRLCTLDITIHPSILTLTGFELLEVLERQWAFSRKLQARSLIE